MSQLCYFDYAATTPVRGEVIAAMTAALEQFGNPSSRYPYGAQAAKRVKEDRATVAQALGCAPDEVFFTSCGTEGDNWAIRKGVEMNRRKGRHIVTTAVEHAAVLETCKDLEHPQHRLLQVPGGGDHGGLDRLPPYRTGIAEAGRTGISGCGNR